MNNIFRFIIKLYFNEKILLKCSFNAFSNLECQCIQFKIHFMFINNDGMQLYIIYHNLDNDNVHARSTHLHCKLQLSCLVLLKSTTTHNTQLQRTSTNFVCQWMNEKSCNIRFVDGWVENHINISFVNGWTCLIIIW